MKDENELQRYYDTDWNKDGDYPPFSSLTECQKSIVKNSFAFNAFMLGEAKADLSKALLSNIRRIFYTFIVSFFGLICTALYWKLDGVYWYHFLLLFGSAIITAPAVWWWEEYFKRIK